MTRPIAFSLILLLLLACCFPCSTSSTRSLRDVTKARWTNVAIAAATGLVPTLVSASSSQAVRIPAEQLAAVFDEWDESLVLGIDPFARLDESDDALFYQNTRFVEHIDADAVVALTRFHRQRLTNLSARLNRAPDLLDLCSSWTSHLPTDVYPSGSVTSPRVTGLGMNMAELLANKQLTERVVQDLNKLPTLPFADKSFDVVLLQVRATAIGKLTTYALTRALSIDPVSCRSTTSRNRCRCSRTLGGC